MTQTTPILEIKDLSVSRGGKVVLYEVDLTVRKGEFIGLVGPNGSGKSTLLLAILGVLNPQNGTIDLYGHKPMSRNTHGRIGWVSQAAAVMPKNVRITVRELIRLGTLNSKNMFFRRKSVHREKVDAAIKMVGWKRLRIMILRAFLAGSGSGPSLVVPSLPVLNLSYSMNHL